MRKILKVLIVLFCSTAFSQSYLDFYFKNKDIDGSILIYDEKKDSWLFNRESDVRKQTPIGSLFNIPNALIALNLGVVSTNPGDYMRWDGVKRYYFGYANPNWSCNTNLAEAIQYKTDWYFQEVSDLVKYKNYEFFLKRLHISNLKYNEHEKYYWQFGNLKSTPEQQVNFFRKLKNQELLFSIKNQEYIYDLLLMIKDKGYSIYGYETFNIYKGERIDWWVGVLETKENTYYFSTRIYESINRDKKIDFQNKKFEITLEIFRLLGYI